GAAGVEVDALNGATGAAVAPGATGAADGATSAETVGLVVGEAGTGLTECAGRKGDAAAGAESTVMPLVPTAEVLAWVDFVALATPPPTGSEAAPGETSVEPPL